VEDLPWTPYFGQGLLYVATILAAAVALSPQFKRPLYYALWGIILAAFGWLSYAHISSDFSFLNVVMHSHTQKPLLYKIAGVWGNLEGSLLLWLTLLVTLGGIAFHALLPGLSFMAYGILAFLLFLNLACTPFTAVLTPLPEGRDLNPLLQHPLLAIHPPLLYLGGGSSFIPVILMSLKNFGRSCRFWTLFSWTFLTLGIVLGSLWAYEELGWGGWWFWDPVENAALIPWLLQTATFHSFFLAKKQQISLSTPKWLSFATLATYLLGLFLTRSGLVTSVHSFAVDPEQSLFLLLVCGGILLPLAYRLGEISSPKKLDQPSGFTLRLDIKIGLFLFCFSAFVILLGTLYPLVLQAFNKPITVGAPYFNATALPLMLLLLALMALQPWLTRTGFKAQQALSPLLLAGAVVLGSWSSFPSFHPLVLLGYGGGIWLILSLGIGLLHHRWTKRQLPMILAHSGVGIAVLGAALSIGFEKDKFLALKPGEITSFQDTPVSLVNISEEAFGNYIAQTATIKVGHRLSLTPQKRFYWTQELIHQKPSIGSSGLDHYAISMGEVDQNGSWEFHLIHKPWLSLLWLGFGLISMAGLWALGKRWF
jgi:cytochrome c-type biogenesis protein CcmF